MSVQADGICNYCGRHARKHEREHGFEFVHVGVTVLKMHKECAARYREQGLMPSATFAHTDDGLRERINRYLDPDLVNGRRVYPKNKLRF